MQKQSPLKTRRSCQDQKRTIRTGMLEMLMRCLQDRSQDTKPCRLPEVGIASNPLHLKLAQVYWGQPTGYHPR